MHDPLSIPSGQLLQYANVQDFWKQHGVPSRREKWVGQQWRMADMSSGYVRGLSGLSGVACVTDGVLLVVRDSNGRLFDCHLDSWVADDSADQAKRGRFANSEKGKKSKVKPAIISIEALADLLC